MALATRGAAPPDYTALAKGNFNEAFTDSEDEGGGPDAGQRRLDYVLLGKACDAATGFAREKVSSPAPPTNSVGDAAASTDTLTRSACSESARNVSRPL